MVRQYPGRRSAEVDVRFPVRINSGGPVRSVLAKYSARNPAWPLTEAVEKFRRFRQFI